MNFQIDSGAPILFDDDVNGSDDAPRSSAPHTLAGYALLSLGQPLCATDLSGWRVYSLWSEREKWEPEVS